MSNTGFKETLARDMADYTWDRDPSPRLMLHAPTIEQWQSEVEAVGNEFKMVVSGKVKGHPDPAFQDGDDICTAAVIWFDRKCRWIRTAQRVYRLGEHAGDEIGIDAGNL
ncbi:hypothetical protein ACTGJ9_018395 [Bradyrhizobium sp. RDM12]